MRKNFLSVCILFFLVLVNPTSSLAVTTPALGAKSWLLMDVVSNQVLASRHAEEKTTARAASKLMTTYLVFGALKEGRLSLKQSVVIPEKIAVLNSGGSRMFLQAGGKATVQELLYGLIVHDADDAALVLSLVVSGAAGHEINFVCVSFRVRQRRLFDTFRSCCSGSKCDQGISGLLFQFFCQGTDL